MFDKYWEKITEDIIPFDNEFMTMCLFRPIVRGILEPAGHVET